MASGDSLLYLPPGAAELSGGAGQGFAGPATLGTVARTPAPTGPQENAEVLLFPDTGSFYSIFNLIMPNHYSGGGLLIDIMWTGVSTASVVEFTSWFTRFDATDPFLTKEPFGGQSDVDGAPTVAREVLFAQIQHNDGAQMGNVVANDFFRLVFYRNANGPPDFYVGDVEVMALYLREQ